jgi:hypothetical protein
MAQGSSRAFDGSGNDNAWRTDETDDVPFLNWGAF